MGARPLVGAWGGGQGEGRLPFLLEAAAPGTDVWKRAKGEGSIRSFRR